MLAAAVLEDTCFFCCCRRAAPWSSLSLRPGRGPVSSSRDRHPQGQACDSLPFSAVCWCKNIVQPSTGRHFFLVTVVHEFGVLRRAPVSPAISHQSARLIAVLRVWGRRGQFLGVPYVPVSTADKVFLLADPHAELIFKMYSVGSYTPPSSRSTSPTSSVYRRCTSAHYPALSPARARDPDS